MSTNIRPDHISAFEALTSGEHDNFALFSFFLDGAPVVAIHCPAGDCGAICREGLLSRRPKTGKTSTRSCRCSLASLREWF